MIDRGSKWKLRFGAVFGGQGLSLVGSALTQFVLLWWIADMTGSVSALATAGVAATLPQALLGPLGGTLADRYSRRLLMIGADLTSAVCMLVLIALFASARIELWHAYAMMAVRSAMQALQAPAASASVTMLVPPSFLTRAAGLNQVMQSMTLIVAAPLGAFVIGVMPIGWALAIDVVTALVAVAALLAWRIPQPRREASDSQAHNATFWHDLYDGVYLVWSNAGLVRLYGLIGLVDLIVLPSVTLLPLLVKQHFHGGAAQVGLMEGLSGAGMLLGGLLVTAWAPRRHIHWVLLGFAASCLSLALTAFAPATQFPIGVAWWIISGITFVLGNAPQTALLQTIIPSHLQGRALALFNSVSNLAVPVGLAVAGPLGEAIGTRALFVVVGVLGAAACMAGFLSPSLRRLSADTKLALPGGEPSGKDVPRGRYSTRR